MIPNQIQKRNTHRTHAFAQLNSAQPWRLSLLMLALALWPTASYAQSGGYRLVELGRLPLPESPDEPAFHLPVGSFLTPGGNVVVLDYFNVSIREFTQRGDLVREFGKQGDGPGEFRSPGGLRRIGGRILVADNRLRRLSWFDTTGVLLEERKYPEADPHRMESPGQVLPLRDGSMVVEWRSTLGYTGGKNADNSNRIVQHDREGGIVRVMDQYRSGEVTVTARKSPDMSLSGGLHFGPGAVVAAWGDSIVAVVDGYAGVVRYWALRGGELREVRTRSLGLKPRRAVISPALQKRIREDRARALRVAPADVEIQAPKFHSWFAGAKFADNGDLWLQREVEQPDREDVPEASRWLVVPWSNNDRVREVEMPENFVLTSINAGNVLIGGQRDDEVPSVRIFRLQQTR